MLYLYIAMMKRITITIDEEMYRYLLDYSVKKGKAELRNVSTSEAVRELLKMQIEKAEKESLRGQQAS